MGRRAVAEVVMPRVVVLDSGAVSALAARDRRARAVLQHVLDEGLAVLVPAPVLAEAYSGRPTDAPVHQLIKTVEFVRPTSATIARRAGELRARSGVRDVVDAIVVAEAVSVPGSIVLTSDPTDIRALIDASGASRVVCVGV